MNFRRKTPWIALAAAVLASACTSAPKGEANRYEGTEGGTINAVEENRALARELAIKNALSKRENDRLVVQFDLENRRSSRLEFAWAVDWFDAHGFQIADATRRWEPISISGYAVQTLKVVAPRPEATSWRLQVTSRDEVK
jgi:uncharacterized protein YcfL